jgi:hypothetical protein
MIAVALNAARDPAEALVRPQRRGRRRLPGALSTTSAAATLARRPQIA